MSASDTKGRSTFTPESAALRDLIRATIPSLVKQLQKQDPQVRIIVDVCLSSLAQHMDFADAMSSAFPSLIELLDNNDSDVRLEAIRRISVWKSMGILIVTPFDIPSIIKRVDDPKTAVQSTACFALADVADHMELRDAIKLGIPSIIQRLGIPDVVDAAGSAILTLAGYTEFRDPIRGAIVPLSEVVGHNGMGDILVQLAAYVELRDEIASVIPVLPTSVLSELVTYKELHGPMLAVFSSVLGKLQDQDPTSWSVVTSTLPMFASQAIFRDAIRPTIPFLVENLNSSHYYQFLASMQAIVKLAGYGEFRDGILTSVPILFGLHEHQNWHVRDAVGTGLAEMATNVELLDAIRVYIPRLVQLLTHEVYGVYAVGTFVKLAAIEGLHDTIRDAFPSLVELLKAKEPSVQSAAVDALSILAELAMFRDFVRLTIPPIIDLVKENKGEAQYVAISTIVKLAEYVEFRDELRASIPLLLEGLDSPNQDKIRHVDTILKLYKHSEFREDIHVAILLLIRWLKSGEPDLADVAAIRLSGLAGYVQLHDTIRAAIPSFIGLLDDRKSTAGWTSITQLAKQEELRNSLLVAIPICIEAFKSPSLPVQYGALSVISELGNNTASRETIRANMEPLIALLKDPGTQSWSRGYYALANLAEHEDLRDAMRPVIPPLFQWLTDPNYNGRPSDRLLAAIQTLSQLTKQASLHSQILDASRSSTAQVIELLKDHPPGTGPGDDLKEFPRNMVAAVEFYKGLPALPSD